MLVYTTPGPGSRWNTATGTAPPDAARTWRANSTELWYAAARRAAAALSWPWNVPVLMFSSPPWTAPAMPWSVDSTVVGLAASPP